MYDRGHVSQQIHEQRIRLLRTCLLQISITDHQMKLLTNKGFVKEAFERSNILPNNSREMSTDGERNGNSTYTHCVLKIATYLTSRRLLIYFTSETKFSLSEQVVDIVEKNLLPPFLPTTFAAN